MTDTPPTLAHNCFVCGPANPIGLRLKFRVEDGVCRAEFTPGENHEGYPGVVHGGILFSVLDDVMANWLYLQGARAYTARCDIRFRKSGAVGERLILEGRHLESRGKVVKMKGTAVQESSGELVAESTGTFMIINPDEFKVALEQSRREPVASEHGSPSEGAQT
ncbi:MAG: PaaI family thioesterase [Gemmatimonadetes bacterium]|nr:PaaI family thioesterase [Gemmatimonadota bacterium]